MYSNTKNFEMHNSDQIIPPVLSKCFDPTVPSRFREVCHTPLNHKRSNCCSIPWIVFVLELAFQFFVSQHGMCLHVISFSIVHKTHPHLSSLSRSFHTWTVARFETTSSMGEGSRDRNRCIVLESFFSFYAVYCISSQFMIQSESLFLLLIILLEHSCISLTFFSLCYSSLGFFPHISLRLWCEVIILGPGSVSFKSCASLRHRSHVYIT